METDYILSLKPYVLVVGCIGVGKTAFIEGIKKYDTKRTYIEIQNLNGVALKVREQADQIVLIKVLKQGEGDTINYESK